MKQFQYISKNENDTKSFAKSLASHLEKTDTIILTGELGCGKTKFVEGILSYFGLADEICSPTFTIVNEYSKKDTKIYHFDVYRLEDTSEFYEMGGDEYLGNGICLIEWGELIETVLPEISFRIHFEKDTADENARILKITTNVEKWEVYFENIKYWYG